MRTVVRRFILAGLVVSGLFLLPQPVSSYCRYCHFQFFVGFTCKDAVSGESGHTYCSTQGGNGCDYANSASCSGSGGGSSDCIEVGGEIICEENQW